MIDRLSSKIPTLAGNVKLLIYQKKMEDEHEQQDTQPAKELSDHEQKREKLLAEAGFKKLRKQELY